MQNAWRATPGTFARRLSGRKVRNTIQEHSGELRVEISGDSSAADRWDTTDGGGMNSVGTKGAITGKGAHVLVIEDPHKDLEEAEALRSVPLPARIRGADSKGPLQAPPAGQLG